MADHQCMICNQTKPDHEFRWNPKFGFRTDCKECEKTQLRCSKCQQVKLLECFPVNRQLSTGRNSVCSDCHASRSAEYRSDPKDQARRKKYSRSEKAVAWRREYNSRPEIKAKNKARNRDRYITMRNDPVAWAKHRARLAVSQALKNGTLTKPECCQANGRYGSNCGSRPVSAHHHMGYAQENWLVVEWLCPACHKVADITCRDDGTNAAPDTVDWKGVLETYGNHCAYCGSEFGPDCAATMDHVQSFDNGGSHTTDNVVPCCIDCNRKKRHRTLRKPLPGNPESVESLLEELKGPPPTYTCTICGESKTKEGFRHGRRGGLRTECLECERQFLRCCRCDTVRAIDEFAPDPAMDTGRRSHCRVCSADHQKKVRSTREYKDKRKEYKKLPHVQAKLVAYRKSWKGVVNKVSVSEKTCSKCKVLKPAEFYSPNKMTSNGLASWCKQCVMLKTHELRERRKQEQHS